MTENIGNEGGEILEGMEFHQDKDQIGKDLSNDVCFLYLGYIFIIIFS